MNQSQCIFFFKKRWHISHLRKLLLRVPFCSFIPCWSIPDSYDTKLKQCQDSAFPLDIIPLNTFRGLRGLIILGKLFFLVSNTSWEILHSFIIRPSNMKNQLQGHVIGVPFLSLEAPSLENSYQCNEMFCPFDGSSRKLKKSGCSYQSSSPFPTFI